MWAIDQSNSPGKTFGGPAHTHAVISFVASGHVLFMDAGARVAVACFRTQPGDAGARQAHMSTPSPDGTYVTVANQNGKLFERILTDYATNTLVHDTTATLNPATGTTPNGLPCQSAALRPDNAPICPITESTSRYTFVTLAAAACSSSTAERRRCASSASTTPASCMATAVSAPKCRARCTSTRAAGPPPTFIRPTCTRFPLTATAAAIRPTRRCLSWYSAIPPRAPTRTVRG